MTPPWRTRTGSFVFPQEVSWGCDCLVTPVQGLKSNGVQGCTDLVLDR